MMESGRAFVLEYALVVPGAGAWFRRLPGVPYWHVAHNEFSYEMPVSGFRNNSWWRVFRSALSEPAEIRNATVPDWQTAERALVGAINRDGAVDAFAFMCDRAAADWQNFEQRYRRDHPDAGKPDCELAHLAQSLVFEPADVVIAAYESGGAL